ncbi:hypothetical protein HNQ07_001785 [Deinococcus metalli]|uniref:Uncharacterized protein n=1 Tax=Deinococcus metalli TaxID=1141878 RepID=A0A7W8KFU4_9DEIO|nr:hypothetical protein [Deinococcus metalli]MBB5376328.1 hypothetical protein [Deinococcus metalli]GHF39105.1 hypothetical protein GCM10017781_14530 [Deinococcus metalli]
MKRLLSLLLLAGTSLAGAASVTLTPGQTGHLGTRTVTLLRVQDSRCPINARCVRAGELKATLLVGEGRRVRLVRVQFPAVGGAWPGLGISGASDVEIGKRVPLRVTLSDTPG